MKQRMERALGVDLDVSALPEMREANDRLGDEVALSTAWERDGYLLFRGVLDLAAVTRLRNVYMAELRNLGVLDSGAQEPICDRAKRERLPKATPAGRGIYTGLAQSRAWVDFVSDPAIDTFITSVLGEKQVWVPVAEYRLLPPEENRRLSRFMVPHQDGYTTEGYESRTCWIPVWYVQREIGGLAVAEGMHRRGYLHDGNQPPNFPIPPGAIPDDSWRTTSFAPGDIVIFDRRLPHCGLRNHSDCHFRLSLDVRCAPQSNCAVAVGHILAITAQSLTLCSRPLSDPDGEERVAMLRLDNDSFCRNVDGESGRLSLGDVPRRYRPGDQVMFVEEQGRVRLLRKPKY